MRGERTKRRIPARDFLSERMALSKTADGTRGEFMSEKGGGDHAPGHGFAVLIAAVIRDAFEGVGESVTVIENFAEAGLAFVTAHYAGFDLHVSRN